MEFFNSSYRCIKAGLAVLILVATAALVVAVINGGVYSLYRFHKTVYDTSRAVDVYNANRVACVAADSAAVDALVSDSIRSVADSLKASLSDDQKYYYGIAERVGVDSLVRRLSHEQLDSYAIYRDPYIILPEAIYVQEAFDKIWARASKLEYHHATVVVFVYSVAIAIISLWFVIVIWALRTLANRYPDWLRGFRDFFNVIFTMSFGAIVAIIMQVVLTILMMK